MADWRPFSKDRQWPVHNKALACGHNTGSLLSYTLLDWPLLPSGHCAVDTGWRTIHHRIVPFAQANDSQWFQTLNGTDWWLSVIDLVTVCWSCLPFIFWTVNILAVYFADWIEQTCSRYALRHMNLHWGHIVVCLDILTKRASWRWRWDSPTNPQRSAWKTHICILSLHYFWVWTGLIKQHIHITIMKTQAMVMKMFAMATTVWSAEMARAIDVAV